MTTNDPSPPTAEETERVNRQPGPKGGPREPAPSRHSPDEQPEESLKPEHRRGPAGTLETPHRPGHKERPERND